MFSANTVEREIRIAASRRAQPVWFRVLKWVIAIAISTWLWSGPYFWFWILGGLFLSSTMHFIWRWKTKAWTQPWRGWNDLETAGKD
jgi:hypothetical protein